MLIMRKLALARRLFGAAALLATCALVAAGQASGPVAPAPQGATQTSAPPAPVLTVGLGQNRFQGSVPTGQATGTALPLSLKDAIDRALKYNLGVIESDQDTRAARSARLRSLNALLPNLSGRVSSTIQQVDLKALGFNFNFPGVSIPTLVGPFSVADARAYVTQQVFNWSDIKNWKSATQSEKAAQYNYKSDRDLVVLTASEAYLLVISDAATVDSTRVQVQTADALHQRAVDQRKAGVIASIDELRAQVELQTQQQRLISAQNQLAIDKLALARVVGLPTGQDFQLTDAVPYAPLVGVTLDEALKRAYDTRPDYFAAKSQVRAAELARQAAAAENYPTVSVNGDYGDIGSPNFATSHGTFTFSAGLNIPIFQGTKVRADKLQADAVLSQRRAEMADIRGRIDDQVRTAFLNLNSSSDLVAVSKSNIDLASRTLTQAQDRFAAGVTDNIEVVQAQESVAAANQSYISSVYAYNVAKVSLAQAIGIAEQAAMQYLEGR
jgi:outer membrane protein TolC